MQRILQLVVAAILSLPAIAMANNGLTGETFGLGQPEPVRAQVTYSVQDTFGLGSVVVVYQDCPGGVCPLPTAGIVTRSTTTTRQPVLRPRTTIQNTYTQSSPVFVSDCPNGQCPLPSQTVIRSAPVSSCPTCPQQSTYYVQSASSYCPTCPTYTATRTVTRQPIIRNYQAQWTFPGDIDSHLMGPPHYVSASQLAVMSYDEKLMLHDQQHNSGISQRSGLFANRPRLFSGRILQRFRSRRGW